MSRDLESFLQSLQSRPFPREVVEEAVKFSAVLPILDRLGWAWSDPSEVVPEYTVEGRRVDFCLRAGNGRVFLEVKRPAEELDHHQEQLLNYSFREGVDIAVLTNGIRWWFYLPTATGSWEQRKFFVVDIKAQEPRVAAGHFEAFLGRQAVSNGSAKKAAARLLSDAQRAAAVGAALPSAWTRLATEPDELLVELLAEATENLCGYRPDDERVAAFLARLLLSGPLSPAAPSVPTASPSPQVAASSRSPRSVTGTTPSSYTFLGETKAVSTWKDILLGVLEDLYVMHPDGFDAVLNLRGRKRDYFSRDGDALYEPRRIGSSPFYAETNLSASNILRRCRDVITLLGHDPSTFSVKTVSGANL